MQETYKKLARAIALIPPKYYLGAAAAVILLLLYGIGRTIVTPVVPEVTVSLESAIQQTMIEQKPAVSVPPAIAEGNLFRKQRKDFTPPASLAESGDEPVPDIKLLGLIVTDTKRIAILDAELKKYIKREIAPDFIISGLKQAPLSDDGHYYEVVPLKGDTLASQTFNEGDIISDYRLEQIDENFIEVSNLASGKRTRIYLLESEKAAASLYERARYTTPYKKPTVDPWHGSGAKTR